MVILTLVFIFVFISCVCLFVWITLNPFKNQDEKNRDNSNITDAPEEDLNLQSEPTISPPLAIQTTSNLSSLPNNQIITIENLGSIVAPPKENTLYVMVNNSTTIKDSNSGHYAAAVYITIGGYFEVNVLREQQKSLDFNDQLEKQLDTLIVRRDFPGISIKDELISLLKSSYAFSTGGCSVQLGLAGDISPPKTLFWQEDIHYSTKTNFASSPHIQKDNKTYVYIGATFSAGQGNYFPFVRMAIQQSRGDTTVSPPITALPGENTGENRKFLT